MILVPIVLLNITYGHAVSGMIFLFYKASISQNTKLAISSILIHIFLKILIFLHDAGTNLEEVFNQKSDFQTYKLFMIHSFLNDGGKGGVSMKKVPQ